MGNGHGLGRVLGGKLVTTIAAPTTRRTAVPVVEVFGPTVQGEGPLAGASTYFVRVGGCDYRCSWCDSMYAVEPSEWKHAPRLTPPEVIERLGKLTAGPSWVTISGGNPGMYKDVGPLVTLLRACNYRVAVETQGSRWQPWMSVVDCLICSPKPPSSGMATLDHLAQWARFRHAAVRAYRTLDGATPPTALKIVVFDEIDYEWAMVRHAECPWPCYLSVGTDAGATADQVLDRTQWLAERMARDRRAADCRVLPQLHVLLWGHARAV
jgi:7-carboxy-7-deazaguanine synthase